MSFRKVYSRINNPLPGWSKRIEFCTRQVNVSLPRSMQLTAKNVHFSLQHVRLTAMKTAQHK